MLLLILETCKDGWENSKVKQEDDTPEVLPCYFYENKQNNSKQKFSL